MFEKAAKALIGHKGRCFDCKIIDVQNIIYVLSASEDGTALLWCPSSNARPIYTFKHSSNTEVLRVSFLSNNLDIICTCSADGIAIIWNLVKESPTIKYSKHNEYTHNNEQIYICESLNRNMLITGAGNSLQIWCFDDNLSPLIRWRFYDTYCDISLNLSPLSNIINNTHQSSTHTHIVPYKKSAQSHHFGGERNPSNDIFVFDMKYYPLNRNIIALGTSDNKIHMINIQESLQQSMNSTSTPNTYSDCVDEMKEGEIHGFNTYGYLYNMDINLGEDNNNCISSLCWHPQGSLLFTCMLYGHILAIDVTQGQILFQFQPHSRSCYGCHILPCNFIKSHISTHKSTGSSNEMSTDLIPVTTQTNSSNYDDNTNLNYSGSTTTNTEKKDILQNDITNAINSFQCVTWSSDATIKVWNIALSPTTEALTTNKNDTAIQTNRRKYYDSVHLELVTNHNIQNYPIYACDFTNDNEWCVCVGGDSSKSTFMGTPVHIFRNSIS